MRVTEPLGVGRFPYLLRYPQKHRQPPFDFHHRVCVQPPEGLADFSTHHRHRLVDHDLRGLAQAVGRVGRHGDAQQRRLDQSARNQQNRDRSVFGEGIGLYDQRRPRLAEIAL